MRSLMVAIMACAMLACGSEPIGSSTRDADVGDNTCPDGFPLKCSTGGYEICCPKKLPYNCIGTSICVKDSKTFGCYGGLELCK
jgi:hypothetical protein